MCGGKYPKFDTPKQLLKVNGEVLVERTIRLLKENGIKDIAISTNDPAFNYLNVELLHNKNDKFVTLSENEVKASKYSWLNAYYPIEEPVCYLHGDVYFSDEAIKTIVNTKIKETMFFCTADKQDILNKDIRCAGGREPLAYKVEDYKLFRNAINDLLQMVDDGKFKNAKCSPIAWTVYRYINGLDVGFNAQNYGDLNNIFKSKGDYFIINDYTTDVDSKKDIPKIEKYMKFKEGKMIKVKVIEDFTLGRFSELKNIQRKKLDTYGRLYKEDVFECAEDLVDYLSGNNSTGKTFVKVIEVIPEIKKPKKNEVEEEKKLLNNEETKKIKKETKPKKRATKKEK